MRNDGQQLVWPAVLLLVGGVRPAGTLGLLLAVTVTAPSYYIVILLTYRLLPTVAAGPFCLSYKFALNENYPLD